MYNLIDLENALNFSLLKRAAIPEPPDQFYIPIYFDRLNSIPVKTMLKVDGICFVQSPNYPQKCMECG